MIAELTPETTALTPDDVVRALRQLPSAPKVLPRLKELLIDGNSGMHEIVALVRLDPGIAARILQVANTTHFANNGRCYTVEEAVNRVGFDEVYRLVSLAVSSQVLVRPLEVYGIEADELWRLSVAGAIAAELLALRTRQDRDVAYTIGLLHCVGMVAIDEWALRHARGLTLSHTGFPREAVESERATFGFSQAEVGAALLRHWDFPTSMSEPVRWQYAPRASASQAKMACLLAAAKWLRSAVCTPKGMKAPPAPDAAHLQLLGLGATALESMVPEVIARMSAVSSLLEDTKRGFSLRRYAFPSRVGVAA